MSIRNPRSGSPGEPQFPRKKPVAKPQPKAAAPLDVKVNIGNHSKLPQIISSKVRSQLEARDKTVPPIAKLIGPEEKIESGKSKKKKHYLDGKLIHIKVGDRSWDANETQMEIDKVQNQVETLFDENEVDCLVLVTHFAVEVKLIGGE